MEQDEEPPFVWSSRERECVYVCTGLVLSYSREKRTVAVEAQRETKTERGRRDEGEGRPRGARSGRRGRRGARREGGSERADYKAIHWEIVRGVGYSELLLVVLPARGVEGLAAATPKLAKGGRAAW